MPPIDAATLARLRARYAPEPWQGACPFCRGATMTRAGTDDGGWLRWRCPACERSYVTAPGDPDVLALVDAYAAVTDELRRSLAAAKTGYVEDFQLVGRLIRIAEVFAGTPEGSDR